MISLYLIDEETEAEIIFITVLRAGPQGQATYRSCQVEEAGFEVGNMAP